MAGPATCLLYRAQVALCMYTEHLKVAPTLPRHPGGAPVHCGGGRQGPHRRRQPQLEADGTIKQKFR